MLHIMSKDTQNHESFHINLTVKLFGKLISALFYSHFLETCVLGRVSHITFICYIRRCDLHYFLMANIDEIELAAVFNSIWFECIVILEYSSAEDERLSVFSQAQVLHNDTSKILYAYINLDWVDNRFIIIVVLQDNLHFLNFFLFFRVLSC